MSNEIMVPEASTLPATLFNNDLAALVNDDALSGASSRVAKITTNGKQFVLVDTAGVETPLRAGDLTIGPDGNSYLPILALRAKKKVTKAWYIKPFNKDAEAQAPDCFSNDGERPDPSIPEPQCETCAGCDRNAWGSGKDAAGNATRGRACSDNKVLAVFAKGSIYELKIMPTALGNWDSLVKRIGNMQDANGNRIPLPFIKILVGFDEAAKHQLYTFSYGGVIGEAQVDKTKKLAMSPEAAEIVDRKMVYTQNASTPTATKNDGADRDAAATKAAKDGKAAAAKKAKMDKAAAATEDDGLGLDDTPVQQEAAAERTQEVAEVATGLTDEEITNELGL